MLKYYNYRVIEAKISIGDDFVQNSNEYLIFRKFDIGPLVLQNIDLYLKYPIINKISLPTKKLFNSTIFLNKLNYHLNLDIFLINGYIMSFVIIM